MTHTWRTAEGDLEVRDMTSSHIANAVAFLQRRAATYRAAADAGGDERRADSYLEWAQRWFKVFEDELARRRDAREAHNDQSVQSEDIAKLLAHPEDED